MFQWECLAPTLGLLSSKCFVAFAKSAQIINGGESATSVSIASRTQASGEWSGDQS